MGVLYDLLPRVIREYDRVTSRAASGEMAILERVFSGFEQNYETIRALINGLQTNVDVENCDPLYLFYMALQLGARLDQESTTAFKRIFVQTLVPTWKVKGTNLSISRLFRSLGFYPGYTDVRGERQFIAELWKTDIYEANDSYSEVQVVSGSPPSYPYKSARIHVYLGCPRDIPMGEAEFALLQEKLDHVKPAHVLVRRWYFLWDVAYAAGQERIIDPTVTHVYP